MPVAHGARFVMTDGQATDLRDGYLLNFDLSCA